MTQALCRAVEISGGDCLTATDSDSNENTYYGSRTMYPNILALAYDFYVKLGADNYQLKWDTSEHKFYVYWVGNPAKTVSSVTGEVAELLGFDGTESAVAKKLLANNKPSGIWCSKHHSSDQGWWSKNPNEKFKGVTGLDGNVSGVVYDSQYHRNVEWRMEPAENILPYANNGTTSDASACFMGVIFDALGMLPTEETSDNLYCKGLYFFEDIDYEGSDLTNQIPGIGPGWGSGGIKSSDDYVFCSAQNPSVDSPEFDRSKKYYSISVKLTTGTAPGW